MMNKLNSKINTYSQIIIITSILFCVGLACNRKVSKVYELGGEKELNECFNLRSFKSFIYTVYPDLKNEKKYVSSEFVNPVVDSDYDIFFRFLSLISGKPTPYNIEVGHYYVKNKEWIFTDSNYQLAVWYINYQDSITCEVFNEYYSLEKAIRQGPKFRVDDFEENLSRSEEYFDSVFNKMHEFEKKYKCYLSEDSINKPKSSMEQ